MAIPPTPQTGAPAWEEAEETPWVKDNKRARIFDAFALRTSVLDRDLTAPPGSCPAKARYLIDTPATGLWAGHEGEIAIAFGANASNGWVFAVVAQEGVQIWIEDELTQIEYAGGNWVVSPERIYQLDDLADVDLAGLNDGDALLWDASNAQWYGAPPSGISTLGEIPDVDLSNIADGHVLKWDASNQKWYTANDEVGSGGGGGATTLNDLSDVDTTGIADGYVLKYDASSGLWFPSADEQGAGGGGGGATALSGLSDVFLSGGIPDGYVLKYDLSAGGWYASEDAAGEVADFTDLGDVPASYSGQGSKIVAVNVGETGLEFLDITTGGYETLDVDFTDGGNTGTSETDLFTKTLDAGELSVNGDRIEAQWSGTFVSSGTATRQLRAYFGGTLVFDTGALTLGTSSSWEVECTVTRVSSSIVRCSTTVNTEGAALAAYVDYTEVTGLTLANTQIIKLTGTAAGVGAASNDIVGKMGSVEKRPITPSVGGGGSDPDGNAALSKPVIADFTLENAGTASMADGTNGIILTIPSTTVNVRFMRYTAGLPGASWTLTMRGRPMTPHNAVVHQRCIMLRNSTNGRLLTFGDPGAASIALSRWASYTSFNAHALNYGANNSDMPWRRLTSDGTTISAYTSVDGQDWALVGTEAIATYLTATGGSLDQVGMGGILGAASTLTTKHLFQSFTLV